MIVTQTQKQNGKGLGVDTVGVGGPVNVRVLSGVSEDVPIEGPGGITHQKAGAPHHANR